MGERLTTAKETGEYLNALPRGASALLAVILLVVCSCSTAQTAAHSVSAVVFAPIQRELLAITGDTWARRGEIVTTYQDAQFAPELLDLAGSVSRAVYRSTSAVTGRPTEVTGFFAVPKGGPPEGGWPVVSVAHGTTGVEHGCGPSVQRDLMGNLPTVLGLLSQGYAVAATDYQGLDDAEVHPYLEPSTAAYNVVDAVRAMAHLFPGVSARWAAVGASQGGQAAWAANEVAHDYGQGLRLVGSVAIAPALNITALAELALEKGLSQEQISAFPLLIVGLERAGALTGWAPYLRGQAVPTREGILGCGPVADWQRSTLRSDDVGPVDAAAAEHLRRALREMALPQRPLSAPALVLNGSLDRVIPPSWTTYSVDLGCKLGGNITHIEVQDADHAGEFPYDAAIDWLDQRYAGAAAQSNCDA